MHTAEGHLGATGRKPLRESMLQRRARGSRVPPEQDLVAVVPDRKGAAKPLHQVLGQVVADDSADPVGPEVPSGQELPLGELRPLAGLAEARLLALDDARVAGEEALPLEDAAELGIRLDERAGDAVPERSSLPRRPAAVQAGGGGGLPLPPRGPPPGPWP